MVEDTIEQEIKNSKHCEYVLMNGAYCKNEVATTNYCNEHSKNIELDIEFYKQIVEHFRQDIREFFIRSNFYFVGQTALIYVIYSRGEPKDLADFIALTGGIVFGIVIAIFWYFVSRGAVIWMHRWRQEVIRIDKMISRFQSYANIESEMRKNVSHSPSRITRWLPLVFILFWLLLLIFNILTFAKII